MLGLGLGAYLPAVLYLVILFTTLASLVRPRAGLYLMALIIPLHSGRMKMFEYPFGDHVVELLLLGVLIGAILQGKSPLARGPFRNHVIGLVVATYISLWVGPMLNSAVPLPLSFSSGTTFGNWILYARMPLLFLLVSVLIVDKKQMRTMLLFMMVSLLWINRGFYNTVGHRDTGQYSDSLRHGAGLGFAGSNGLAAFQAQCLLLMLSIVWIEKSKKVRVLILAIALTSGFSLLFSYSRGAYVAFAAGLLYMAFFRVRLLIPAIILGGLFWQAILPESVQQRITMSYDRDSGALDTSSSERINLWMQALELAATDPLFGIGFDAFRFYRMDQELRDTHNMYLKCLSETGLIGFFLLVGLWIRALWASHFLMKTTHDPSFRALGCGFAAYMVAVMVTNLFGDRWTYLEISGYTWVLMAMVLRAQMLSDAVVAPEAAATSSAQPELQPHLNPFGRPNLSYRLNALRDNR
jgi:putative inorganic carbon (hco3(-)) transporter